MEPTIITKPNLEPELEIDPVAEKKAVRGGRKISPFASVQLSVFLMVLMAITVLLGAWCPQEGQVGQDKVFEAFNPEMAQWMIKLGISDIFHTPWFLALTAMMTLNMIVVSFQRVFPKIKTINEQLPFFGMREINRLPVHHLVSIADPEQKTAIMADLTSRLTRMGYKVEVEGHRLRAQFGKYGRLAASVTHVGLLSLLAGVSITSWTGFNGFKPVLMRESLDFKDASHAKLWVGKIPDWTARVQSTRRENYPSGEAKQWYSLLSVRDAKGKEITQGEISVNNPLSYDGVDIYQSSWGLDKLVVAFNGKERKFDLNSMGNRYAAMLPLTSDMILIMSLPTDGSEMRLFAKIPQVEQPRLLTTVAKGQTVDLGDVKFTFKEAIPITGLQYKCDPGLPVTYAAFFIIMAGVMLAAVPHRHVWASIENGGLYFGGASRKAKVGFEIALKDLAAKLGERK